EHALRTAVGGGGRRRLGPGRRGGEGGANDEQAGDLFHGNRSPSNSVWIGPVLARSTIVQARRSCSVMADLPLPEASIRTVAARWASSAVGCRTEVSAGVVRPAIEESSKPATATSWGTARPS